MCVGAAGVVAGAGGLLIAGLGRGGLVGVRVVGRGAWGRVLGSWLAGWKCGMGEMRGDLDKEEEEEVETTYEFGHCGFVGGCGERGCARAIRWNGLSGGRRDAG